MSADSILMSLVRRLRRSEVGDESKGKDSWAISGERRAMLWRGEGVGESASMKKPSESRGEVMSRVVGRPGLGGRLSTTMAGMSVKERRPLRPAIDTNEPT
jgi:hypothetical protein